MLKLIVATMLVVALYRWRDRLMVPLFRLPGDIEINAGRFRLEVPFTTCLLVSLGVSLIWWTACGR